jgi:hypothetical protein
MARERLGLAVIPGAGWSARDIQDVAREADAAGFDAIFSTEVNNDRAGHGPTYGLRNRAHAVVWCSNSADEDMGQQLRYQAVARPGEAHRAGEMQTLQTGTSAWTGFGA